MVMWHQSILRNEFMTWATLVPLVVCVCNCTWASRSLKLATSCHRQSPKKFVAAVVRRCCCVYCVYRTVLCVQAAEALQVDGTAVAGNNAGLYSRWCTSMAGVWYSSYKVTALEGVAARASGRGLVGKRPVIKMTHESPQPSAQTGTRESVCSR